MAAVAAVTLLLLVLTAAAALTGGDDSDWVRLPSKCEGKRGRRGVRRRVAAPWLLGPGLESGRGGGDVTDEEAAACTAPLRAAPLPVAKTGAEGPAACPRWRLSSVIP